MRRIIRKGMPLCVLLIALVLAVSCRSNPSGSSSLAIETDKVYAVGEGFMSSDFSVIATLANGRKQDVTEGASFSVADATEITGETKVTATWNGLSASYTIIPKGEVTGILVTAEPKTIYGPDDDRLDLKGLSVLVLTTTGTGSVVSYGDPRLSTDIEQGTVISSDTVLTVTYMNGFKTKIDIEWNEPIPERTLTGIMITGYPKTEYKEGELLDLTGLTVLAKYSDGSIESTADEEITSDPAEGTPITKGTVVTITYREYTAAFGVSVEEEPVLSQLELMDKPAYNGYLNMDEVSSSFDMQGLTVRAIFSDGSDTVLGAEDMVFGGNGTDKVAITAEAYGETGYTVYASLGEIREELYTAEFAEISKLSVIQNPYNTLIRKDQLTEFSADGLRIYAEYTGGRNAEFIAYGDEGLTINAFDNGDGATWSAEVLFCNASITLGPYEYIPDVLDTGLTITDSLGTALDGIGNGTEKITMLGDGIFTVEMSTDVSSYSSQWYVDSKPITPDDVTGSVFTFSGLERGMVHTLTGIFRDGSGMGVGSVQLLIQITDRPYID